MPRQPLLTHLRDIDFSLARVKYQYWAMSILVV